MRVCPATQELWLKHAKQPTEEKLDAPPFVRVGGRVGSGQKSSSKRQDRAYMPEAFISQDSFSCFLKLLRQLRDEVVAQDGVQYSPSLQQLIDWPLLIDMAQLQVLIDPLLKSDLEWLKYAVGKVGGGGW
jgi:hypothetical protein